jgi:hypothetical protein
MTLILRDKLKDFMYLKTFIDEKNISIKESNYMIEAGQVIPKRIPLFRKMILDDYLQVTIAQYSIGSSISIIKQSYLATLDYITNSDCWNPLRTKPTREDGSQVDIYYVKEHGIMLRLLALGILLKMSKTEFSILVDIIDRDNVVDNVYEFLIRHYYPERKQGKSEAYVLEEAVSVKVYQKLRDAIRLDSAENTDEKIEAESSIKGFLQKGFYHKHSGFHNDHKYEPVKLYYGYWSFEAAAVTCLMGLDDKSYRKHKYYPVDLADYYREQSE